MEYDYYRFSCNNIDKNRVVYIYNKNSKYIDSLIEDGFSYKQFNYYVILYK